MRNQNQQNPPIAARVGAQFYNRLVDIFVLTLLNIDERNLYFFYNTETLKKNNLQKTRISDSKQIIFSQSFFSEVVYV